MGKKITDKMRLDWLSKRPWRTWDDAELDESRLSRLRICDGPFRLRQAIDAAIRAERRAKKGQ